MAVPNVAGRIERDREGRIVGLETDRNGKGRVEQELNGGRSMKLTRLLGYFRRTMPAKPEETRVQFVLGDKVLTVSTVGFDVGENAWTIALESAALREEWNDLEARLAEEKATVARLRDDIERMREVDV